MGFLKTTNSLKDCCLLVRIIHEAAQKYSTRNDYHKMYNFRIPIIHQLITKSYSQWHQGIMQFSQQKSGQDLLPLLFEAREAYKLSPEGWNQWLLLIENGVPQLTPQHRQMLRTLNYNPPDAHLNQF